jgi:excisionase family DNA binding protein
MAALAPHPRPTIVANRPDRPFTVSEACDYLQISRPKLYGLARDGQLKMITVGVRGTRLPAADVYALANGEAS